MLLRSAWWKSLLPSQALKRLDQSEGSAQKFQMNPALLVIWSDMSYELSGGQSSGISQPKNHMALIHSDQLEPWKLRMASHQLGRRCWFGWSLGEPPWLTPRQGTCASWHLAVKAKPAARSWMRHLASDGKTKAERLLENESLIHVKNIFIVIIVHAYINAIKYISYISIGSWWYWLSFIAILENKIKYSCWNTFGTWRSCNSHHPLPLCHPVCNPIAWPLHFLSSAAMYGSETVQARYTPGN